MTLEVELCGRLAEAGGRTLALAVPAQGMSVRALFDAVAATRPALADALGSRRIRACVNDAIVDDLALVLPDDRVALFPPVSGG